MSLEGLAKALFRKDALRKKLLKDGTLLSWPSPELVGVCQNPDCQKMNFHLLVTVADIWCPQWDSTAMIPIDEAKAQAPDPKACFSFSFVGDVLEFFGLSYC